MEDGENIRCNFSRSPLPTEASRQPESVMSGFHLPGIGIVFWLLITLHTLPLTLTPPCHIPDRDSILHPLASCNVLSMRI
jgi:hypothetical protein